LELAKLDDFGDHPKRNGPLQEQVGRLRALNSGIQCKVVSQAMGFRRSFSASFDSVRKVKELKV